MTRLPAPKVTTKLRRRPITTRSARHVVADGAAVRCKELRR